MRPARRQGWHGPANRAPAGPKLSAFADVRIGRPPPLRGIASVDLKSPRPIARPGRFGLLARPRYRGARRMRRVAPGGAHPGAVGARPHAGS